MTLSLRTHILLAALLWSASLFATTPAANAGIILQAPTYMGLSSGLVGYWSFNGNDVAGNVAYDRSGQGNNGTLGNSETFANIPVRTAGKIGQALNFNGTAYVDLANPASLNNISRKTISAWIYPRRISAAADVGRILDKNHGGETGWIFYICNAGDELGVCQAGYTNRIAFYRTFSGASDGAWISSSDNAVTLNAWQHVSITYDDSSVTNDPIIYVNGTPIEITEHATPVGSADSESSNVLMLANRSGLDGGFDGFIDDARIYSRLLTADEIKRLYKIGSTAKFGVSNSTGSLASGLVGWWTFDGKDIAGDIAYDRSGQGNNGTLAVGPTRTIGKIGQAMEFHNEGGGVNFFQPASLTTLANLTVSAWIKLRSYPTCGGDQAIAHKGHGSGVGWALGLPCNLTNTVFFRRRFTSGTDIARTASDNSIAVGQWQHVLVTYASSTDATNARIYINGVETPYQETVNGVGGHVDDAGFDGIISDGPDGIIDDVRIYNRALTTDEIKRLYKMGQTLKTGVTSSTGSLSSGLVGYWSFNGNDVAGNRANDLSGRGNNGTLTNGPQRAIGKIGQALNFDGVNDFVDIESNMDVNGSGITLAAWAKPTSLSTDFRIISKSDGTQEIAHVWMLGNCSSVSGCAGSNEPRARISISGTTYTFFSSNFVFEQDVWQFVAVTYDGDAVRFFKNGVSETQDAANGTVGTDNTMNVYIGANHDGAEAGGNPFPGLLDEVRVYDRALSVDELKRLYQMGR